jgi:hypothetical protein
LELKAVIIYELLVTREVYRGYDCASWSVRIWCSMRPQLRRGCTRGPEAGPISALTGAAIEIYVHHVSNGNKRPVMRVQACAVRCAEQVVPCSPACSKRAQS